MRFCYGNQPLSFGLTHTMKYVIFKDQCLFFYKINIQKNIISVKKLFKKSETDKYPLL